jgi:uncharacterized membrane protein
MSMVLISVFDGHEQAGQGAAVLRAMESQGAVDLNAVAIVKRDADNRVTVEGSEMPLGVKPVVVGMIAGSLVGLLFGPMGAAVGGIIGVTGGISHTVADGDSASAFLDEVARRIGPGASAVIAELNGEVDQKLGDRLRELGGTLFWTSRKQILSALKTAQVEQIIADEKRRRKPKQTR